MVWEVALQQYLLGCWLSTWDNLRGQEVQTSSIHSIISAKNVSSTLRLIKPCGVASADSTHRNWDISMISEGSYRTRLSSNLKMVMVLSVIEMGQSFCTSTCGCVVGIMLGIMFAGQHTTSHMPIWVLFVLKWNHVRCILTNNWTFHSGIVSDQSAVQPVKMMLLLTDSERLVICSSMTKAIDRHIRHISHRILHVYKEHYHILHLGPHNILVLTGYEPHD